jgi:transposase
VVVLAQVRRVDCRGCGRVRTEQVPWARPGARHTRDFENTAAWLVRRMSKAAVATLLRTSWNTVEIRAISMDMTRVYREAARIHLPQAAICYDPSPLIKWAGEALDQVHLATPRDSGLCQGSWTVPRVWLLRREAVLVVGECFGWGAVAEG